MTILYVHKSCFDGVISGAMASVMLETVFGRTIEKVVPVDYDLRHQWKQAVTSESCIVDFLYHPRAAFWWDHHANPFVDTSWKASFDERKGRTIHWNPNAPSCARLIADDATAAGVELPDFLQTAIDWADKIDAAIYESPSEAVSTVPAARQLALSLAVDSSANYHTNLISSLKRQPMDQLVTKSGFRDQCVAGVSRYEKGLRMMESKAKLDRGVVTYRLRLHDEIIDRMMPYYFFPKADFSLGIIAQGDQFKVTCNSNPWTKPQGINVGEVFSSLGGGGHRDVGSVIVSKGGVDRAENILDRAKIRLTEHVTA